RGEVWVAATACVLVDDGDRARLPGAGGWLVDEAFGTDRDVPRERDLRHPTAVGHPDRGLRLRVRPFDPRARAVATADDAVSLTTFAFVVGAWTIGWFLIGQGHWLVVRAPDSTPGRVRVSVIV